MINKSNVFKIVALVIFMLMSVVSTWADDLIFNGNPHYTGIKFHTWSGVGNATTVTTENPEVTSFSPNTYNEGATVIGTSVVNRLIYADMYGYAGIRVKGTAGKNVRFLFNRQSDASSNNGLIEVSLAIPSNGVLELNFNSNDLLKDCEYYHLNAIKIPYGQFGTQITEVSAIGNSELPKFRQYNDVNASSVANENPSIITFTPQTYGEGATVIGTGDVHGYYYAVLDDYVGLRIKGTAGKTVRFLFNRQTADATNNGLIEVALEIPSSGILDLDFKENDLLKDCEYYHLNAIKIPWGQSGTQITELQAITNYMGSWDKNTDVNVVFSRSYRIPNNRQYMFTFRNSRNSTKSERWFNWVMWTSTKARTESGIEDYFYMNLAPCVRKHITRYDDFWGNYEATTVYVKGQNGLTALETDAEWQQFLNDMWQEAYVTVKVLNYNGIIRVYSVMQDKNKERTYVYPYQYEKYDIDGTKNGDVYAYFSVDHTIVTDFASSYVDGIAALNYNIESSDRTQDDKARAECSVTMATPEGLNLPTGTYVGLNDEIRYSANAGSSWEFERWGGWNGSDKNDITRNITVKSDHVADGTHLVVPTATFRIDNTVADPSKSLVFAFDFENVEQSDLKDGADAPTGGLDGVTENTYWNYGGRGRILTHPTFGHYYQNLADADEFTKSKSENFLRIILTDEQKTLLNNISFYKGTDGKPDYSRPKPEGTKCATVGFWVNAKKAIDYDLPLERGSMFCMFSNERFQKADDNLHPRYMFDLSCNGWVYSYMPNSFSRNKTDENGNVLYDEDNNPITESVEYVNKFFYGEDEAVVTGRQPKTSLFGTKNYANTQNQLQTMFYRDVNYEGKSSPEWHYVTYVATNDLKTVTLYLDGKKCETIETETLGDGFVEYEEGGDYPGRAYFLRNIVLGGYTPHGLFFSKQYYSDAALAYDDIAVYSEALTQEQIVAIMNKRHYQNNSWYFTDYLTELVPTGSQWADNTTNNPITYNSGAISTGTVLKDGGSVLGGTVDLKTKTLTLKFGATGGQQIFVDQTRGTLGLREGASLTVPSVPKNHTVTMYFTFAEKEKEKQKLPTVSGMSEAALRFITEVISETNDTTRYYAVTYKALNDGTNDYTFNFQNGMWLMSMTMSPYQTPRMNYVYGSKHAVISSRIYNFTDKEFTKTPSNLPKLDVQIDGDTYMKSISQTETRFDEYTTVEYSSSAPLVASVDAKGTVSLTGLPGKTTITAKLVSTRTSFDPNLDDIKASYNITVTDDNLTKKIASGNTCVVGQDFYLGNDKDNASVLVTAGGWEYGDHDYSTKDSKVTDSWSKAAKFTPVNDASPVDGFNYYVLGQQNAMSESYGMNGDFDSPVGNGRFIPAKSSTDNMNVKPWTLPCRGTYLKVQPKKSGVLSMYVLQNGNLGNEYFLTNTGDTIKDNKTSGKTTVKKWCTTVNWRPVYVADETGKIISDVRVTSNSKISPYDNFFREGRRRAQFIYEIEDTWNQELKASMKKMEYSKLSILMDNWNNAEWKQRIIPSGDGGHMVMSKGMVRYTFNVLPGKTYYIFSNSSKIGYAGYTFDEGKLLNDAEENAQIETLRDATVGTAITIEDKLTGKQKDGSTYTMPEFTDADETTVTYNRKFTSGLWSSICLPFSMNSDQVKKCFGNNTAVVLLKEIHPETGGKIELIWHANQDIIAGYPYFILPRSINDDKEDINVGDVISGFTTNAHFDAANPLFNVSSNGTVNNNAVYNNPHEDYPYYFEGNFVNAELKAGSYVMANNGKLTQITNDTKAKPFRAYLKYVGEYGEAKQLFTDKSFEINGETTTSIEAILEDNGIILDSSDVFDVNGVKVRSNTHSLEGLPKGIYIVNGKKYVVK